MAGGELRTVGIRRLVFVALAAAVVLVGTIGPAAASNDPLFAQQWGLTQIGAPAAWPASTGAGVTIGIVDTGVVLQHEDLAGKVIASANCIGGCTGAPAQDDNGHGTHVSGIAAAFKDNGRGVAGVAPDAKLVVAKALDGNGSGSVDDVNAGIQWVVDHGAKVVNLSLGSDVPLLAGLFGDNSLEPGVDYAWNHGAVAVLAAGNSNFFGFGSSNYGSAKALVVGATRQSGQPTSYSSPIGSAQWGLVAPGGESSSNPDGVVSTFWDKDHPSSTNSYAFDAGTSMAAPHVTGAMALLLARGYSRDAAINRILSTAAPIPGCGSGTCGKGRLNVAAAVGPPGPGGAPAPAATGTGTGAPPASPPRVIKPATGATVKPGTTIAQSPESTTTVPPAAAAALPGDNPVVAAGQPKGDVKANSGKSSSRAGQVALAIGLLGATGLGSAFAVRRLRAGAAP